MQAEHGRPLIVQSDRTVFLEVAHPDFERARDRLTMFAELEKSPEHVHVYRITPLALWNAAASGETAEAIIEFLTGFSKYPVPPSLRKEIVDFMGRYGLLRLETREGHLELCSSRPEALLDAARMSSLKECFLEEAPVERAGRFSLGVEGQARGALKVGLIKLGFPVEDVAGYREGARLDVQLLSTLRDGRQFTLRPYQRDAVEAFWAGGGSAGGSGVVVLPCGAGKTIVAMGALERVGAQTLILSSNVTALRQWRRELLEKTNLGEDMIGEYSGEQKEIRPVTLTTYQMLTYRRSRGGELVHLQVFRARDWGLIVYDEVHLLPAPVFRLAAEIQATRRLGLTATLVREDGREDEVFSLIGPKKYDVPWRTLENQGWIANAQCVEIRVDLSPGAMERYLLADNRGKFRIASENDAKLMVVRELVRQHHGDRILVIGQYLDQLKRIRRELNAPLITGKTTNAEREDLYARFRSGDIPVLVVSKVGNFAVDLPDANIAVQISGTFGSRQEEAQRLGRILRPKKRRGPAVFYSIVTRSSRDQQFAEKRQLFLTEQGYAYRIQEYGPEAVCQRGDEAMEQAS